MPAYLAFSEPFPIRPQYFKFYVNYKTWCLINNWISRKICLHKIRVKKHLLSFGNFPFNYLFKDLPYINVFFPAWGVPSVILLTFYAGPVIKPKAAELNLQQGTNYSGSSTDWATATAAIFLQKLIRSKFFMTSLSFQSEIQLLFKFFWQEKKFACLMLVE